jgi:hypothetical protein
MKQIVAVFLIFNILFALVSGVFWVHPTVEILRRERAAVRISERQYATQRGFFENLDANKSEIEELSRNVLRPDEKLPVLARISRLGALNGIETLEFGVSQGSLGGSDEAFIETRVYAEYLGSVSDFISFLHEFSESSGYLLSFTINTENKRMRLDFALYGGV